MDTSCFCQCVSQAGVHSSHEPYTWSSWLNQNRRSAATQCDDYCHLCPTSSRTHLAGQMQKAWVLAEPSCCCLPHCKASLPMRWAECSKDFWFVSSAKEDISIPLELEACNIQYTWNHRKTRPDERKWLLSHKKRRLMTLVWDKTLWFHPL
jgi:hypothetical protein